MFALRASSMYHVHHASICVDVVIGVLVFVLCELHVVVRVHVIPLCGAVVGLTLGLLLAEVRMAIRLSSSVCCSQCRRWKEKKKTGKDMWK